MIVACCAAPFLSFIAQDRGASVNHSRGKRLSVCKDALPPEEGAKLWAEFDAEMDRPYAIALALQIKDVTADGLIIRQTKFKKSRLVPLHETTQRALDTYITVRAAVRTLDGSLFVSVCGRALAYTTVVAVFLELARSIGVRGAPGQRGPRIHDLRHNSGNRIIPATDGQHLYFLGNREVVVTRLAE
jgi:hypothetical protein